MEARAASASIYGAASGGVDGPDTERDRKSRVRINSLAFRRSQNRRLAAACLAGSCGFGGSDRGLIRRFLPFALATFAVATVVGPGGSWVRTGGGNRQRATPTLGESQEEGIAQSQTSHEQAHTLILRCVEKKVQWRE
jgi:hypothetical protein